jgi:hypothetical protein
MARRQGTAEPQALLTGGPAPSVPGNPGASSAALQPDNSGEDHKPMPDWGSPDPMDDKVNTQLLKELQKQRKSAELVVKVAEEKQLLITALNCAGLPIPAHLQAAGAAAVNPENQAENQAENQSSRTEEPMQPELWGQKRPHADTAVPVRPPPKPAMDGLYEGRNMKEYNTFMLRMENHFLRYASWFTTDEAKVADGVQCLNDDLLLKWHQHVKNSPGEDQTWESFSKFFLWQINDPKNLICCTHQ